MENNKYFKNKEDEIALSMVANLQIHCEEQKKFTQKKITDFFNCTKSFKIFLSTFIHTNFLIHTYDIHYTYI